MTQTKKILLGITGIAIVMVIGTIFINSSSHAQDDEVQRLRRKITELENRIIDLERLLSRHATKETVKFDEDLNWENKKNWRKLRLGMTEKEVKEILGNPIKTIYGVRTLWYYPNLYCGLVSFDEKGYLTSWHEP